MHLQCEYGRNKQWSLYRGLWALEPLAMIQQESLCQKQNLTYLLESYIGFKRHFNQNSLLCNGVNWLLLVGSNIFVPFSSSTGWLRMDHYLLDIPYLLLLLLNSFPVLSHSNAELQVLDTQLHKVLCNKSQCFLLLSKRILDFLDITFDLLQQLMVLYIY